MAHDADLVVARQLVWKHRLSQKANEISRDNAAGRRAAIAACVAIAANAQSAFAIRDPVQQEASCCTC
jgi:hypothetical protein